MSNECRIHVLSDLLVSKIAAGEVVDRPASIVKELIDNALDAGAERIGVTIENGGRQLIRVTDDGCGMSSEELRLAITPHATSKIVSEEDLYAIATMGFRGEALPSIGAVSKLRITSRRGDDDAGHEIRVVGERVEASQAAGCPVGTTVEVRDLFFNVPARRKFLRAVSTETGHINEQFARAALAWPSVGFELTNRGRKTQNLPPCKDVLDRIVKFYGPELASALMHARRRERGVEIEAYIAPPAQSRATAQWQYTYVNGRPIRDKFIQHAIKEAYRGLMEPNRHGVVFLFLTIDPALVDVNVHPTKIEVRWADSNLIHSQVLSALRETLQRADLTPTVQTERMREPIDPERQERMRCELASVLKSAAPIQPTGGHRPTSPTGSAGGAGFEHRRGPMPTSPDPTETWRSLYGEPRGGPMDTEPGTTGATLQPPSAPVSGPRVIQMHNLYLVAETEEGIVIVDQHALHERVIYEQLRERLTGGALESQRLLLPETFNVTPAQSAALTANAELLDRLGIDVAGFGADAVAVHAFPSILKDVDVVAFMGDLLDRLGQQPGGSSTEEVLHDLLDMMACKAAVKAGDPLSREEIEALMQQRHLIERSSSCPHGRPTMLRLTRADLDRQFKRT